MKATVCDARTAALLDLGISGDTYDRLQSIVLSATPFDDRDDGISYTGVFAHTNELPTRSVKRTPSPFEIKEAAYGLPKPKLTPEHQREHLRREQTMHEQATQKALDLIHEREERRRAKLNQIFRFSVRYQMRMARFG